MLNLTTKQKAYLRSLAQTLRPQLHIGYEGYTAGVRSALEDLFKHRELVKCRVLKSSDEAPKELAEALANDAQAALVGVVGKTFVLYRPNPELKERIELPVAAQRPGIASSRPATASVLPRRSASKGE